MSQILDGSSKQSNMMWPNIMGRTILILQEYSIWFFSFPVLRLFYFGWEPCFFSERIMLFFTNERELVTMGSEYLRMIGISYLLSAIAQVCMTIMKNCGAIRLSTVISSVTVILNIMLNGIFIFGLFGMPAM